MYPSSTSSSQGNAMVKKLKGFGSKPNPHLRIDIDGSTDASSVLTFSTLDTVRGTVSVCLPYSTTLADIQINLIGTSKTFVERQSNAPGLGGRTEASHKFLRLVQPIASEALPAAGLLEAGRTYRFSFLFVVPEQLLPRVCSHGVTSEQIRHSHLNLPPSLGDQHGDTHADDMAPHMASIRYAVVATLDENRNGKLRSLTESRIVRILPATEEQPPVNVDGPDNDYVLRHEKDVKKGVFKGRLGRLVVQVAQSKSMRLPAPDSDETSSPSTMARIALRFDPAESTSQPPILGTLSSKLRAGTYFATAGRSTIPNKKTVQFDAKQGYYAESVGLPSRCVAGVEWTHHAHNAHLDKPDRRDSLVSIASSSKDRIPEPSAKYRGQGFYTAQILVPINLPTNKTFVPTFHSCLTSRIYSISLSLGLHGAMGPSFELKVPLQISSEGNTSVGSQPMLTPEEAELELLGADDFFAPTSTSTAGEETPPLVRIPPPREMPPQYTAGSRRAVLAVPLKA